VQREKETHHTAVTAVVKPGGQEVFMSSHTPALVCGVRCWSAPNPSTSTALGHESTSNRADVSRYWLVATVRLNSEYFPRDVARCAEPLFRAVIFRAMASQCPLVPTHEHCRAKADPITSISSKTRRNRIDLYTAEHLTSR